ncbi:DUF2780 domain-containing protein [Paraglaciecola hydrolytica]|uniref:DUF2780 domain-containing protein n=1 Tax=Paraglaciecola hydrolytica TaxID=1799789 RepID=A0A136A622_9ALTE|nr:DUF2780 domain-containing protein [Paraglaciecola hydrolytica]KXI30674.1 hypothetical protein AX660_04385 [Paraglaciecola hydrolytica]
MKLQHLSLIFAAIAFSSNSNAAGWLDSIKSALGMEVEAQAQETEVTNTAMLNMSDMVSAVSDQLGVNNSQAAGGLASIFNYAKGNLSSEQFGGLTESLPGLSELLSKVPDAGNVASEGGLGGLMDKAASFNDSLKAANEVKKQFAALGLDAEMIMQYVNVAKAYLDTEEGKQVKDTLMQGLGNLMS